MRSAIRHWRSTCSIGCPKPRSTPKESAATSSASRTECCSSCATGRAYRGHVQVSTGVAARPGLFASSVAGGCAGFAGTGNRVASGGLFVFIGADAHTQWLPPQIALDPKGYVLACPDVRAAGLWRLDRAPYLVETSVPGIFACGDVRFSPVKRVAAAVGEGSMAIAFVHQYLREHGA